MILSLLASACMSLLMHVLTCTFLACSLFVFLVTHHFARSGVEDAQLHSSRASSSVR